MTLLGIILILKEILKFRSNSTCYVNRSNNKWFSNFVTGISLLRSTFQLFLGLHTSTNKLLLFFAPNGPSFRVIGTIVHCNQLIGLGCGKHKKFLPRIACILALGSVKDKVSSEEKNPTIWLLTRPQSSDRTTVIAKWITSQRGSACMAILYRPFDF